MTPPLGSVIVGPCPSCSETVLVYDGTVMPLDKEIIADGSAEEKKQHLLEAIVDMAAGKIDDMIENGDIGGESTEQSSESSKSPRKKKLMPSVRDKKAPYISREDVSDFINIDLRLIDSKNYFDKAFASKKARRRKRS
jgi:hypothetical protein